MGRLRIGVCLFSIVLGATLLLVSCARPAPAPAPAATSVPKPAASPAPSKAPAPAPKPAVKSLIFGSEPIGTSTYVVSTGVASLVEKYVGVKVIVQPMATMNLLFNELTAGRADILLQGQGNSYLVFRGQEEFKDVGPRTVYRLGSGNPIAYAWVTRPDTGIKSIPDMAGKKAAYLSAVSAPVTETFRLVLEHYGIDKKVTALNRTSMETAAQQLIEKKVDVIGGPYGSFAYNIKEATGLVVIPIDEAATKYVQQKRPDLCRVMGTFDAGYFALPSKIDCLASVKEMVVTPRMSEDIAYAVCKAVYDHLEEAKAIHRDVAEFNLSNALGFDFFIPTHAGAIKYFKEKGIWTKKHDEMQQKYLAEEKQLGASAKK